MPYMKDGRRDYKRELDWEHEHKPSRVKDRASRNKARDMMIEDHRAFVGDGRDVGHKKALSKGGKTERNNLQMQNATNNRSFSRNANGSMHSERSKRGR